MAAALLPRSAKKNKWYFTREQIHNSPSRRAGLDPDKELSYRQRAANLIQDIGQRLNVSQLTINTAIVYMHRFYMIQSFTRFHRNVVGPAALFLATKVEEQPRKLEHVVKVANVCLNPQDPSPDSRKPAYQLQAQDVVVLENVILQTLGFDVRINHPHTHVVKCTELVRASKDLAQTSYFMATNRFVDSDPNPTPLPPIVDHFRFVADFVMRFVTFASVLLFFSSLHLTTFCLQYNPTIVACVCIHLACKWSNWEIPVSTDSKHWWEYVDPTVTLELLDELTHEFLQILEKTPSCLKRIRNWKAPGQKKSKTSDDGGTPDSMMNMLALDSESALASLMSLAAPPSTSSTSSVTLPAEDKQPVAREPIPEPAAPPRVSLSLSEYRAKHADELAAQKKKLENMEASVKRDYATAAQALMNQQRKEKHHHNHHQHHQQQHSGSGSSEPILLKIPLEKRHDRGSHKSGQSGSNRASEHNIKVKIRVSEKGQADELRSKDKHRERSNHHHHHHHHHHHSGSGYSSSSAPHRHSSSASSGKKSAGDGARTNSSSSSSRKRTHPSEPAAGSHPAKMAKPSRNSFQLPQLPADILPSLALSQPQGSFSHSKSDKADTNGHGAGAGGQPNEFQDTYDMLNSLLSAQGVQPNQPPMLYPQYNEYRFAQHPPLPLEPPPHLPPLPK